MIEFFYHPISKEELVLFIFIVIYFLSGAINFSIDFSQSRKKMDLFFHYFWLMIGTIYLAKIICFFAGGGFR